MKEFYLYNSISQKKEKFVPSDPKNVKIYSCGPTVYNFCHIGNLRNFIFTDLLRRSLKLFGYEVNHTMNITDVDDKIIQQASKKNLTVQEFTKPWIKAFFEDLTKLNIQKVEHYPKATDSITEMIELLNQLKANGFIYEKEDGIYYNLQKFPKYGILSRLDKSKLKTGLRYNVDEYDKNDIRDFVVWKKENKAKYSWKTIFGQGRPGWHLECSAMIYKIYPSGIDIHTGGIDLLFPHHENELAQFAGAYPEKEFVKYWLHCEHLFVENEKMSKSKGNFYILQDLIQKGFSPKAIRFMMLNCHYRTKLNFSTKQVEDAFKSTQKIQNCLNQILEKIQNQDFNKTQKPSNYSKNSFDKFCKELADNLNTPRAFANLFEEVHKINSDHSQKRLSQENYQDIYRYFYQIDSILGILDFSFKENRSDREIEKLLEKRQEAKRNKNFQLADEIRDKLKEKAILIEDTKDGTRWKYLNEN